MLDFAFTFEIVSRNFDLIGIAPEKIDGLWLSHGHRDHFGGMDGFVRQFRTRMKGSLALRRRRGHLPREVDQRRRQRDRPRGA